MIQSNKKNCDQDAIGIERRKNKYTIQSIGVISHT